MERTQGTEDGKRQPAVQLRRRYAPPELLGQPHTGQRRHRPWTGFPHYPFQVAQPYCFVCDTPVAAEICPTCNTATWHPTERPAVPRPHEPAEDITMQPAPARNELPPLPPPIVSPPSGADLPGGVKNNDRSRRQAAPGRWAPIAAVVLGGIIFLSVLTGPSGLEPADETIEAPTITAQTTTTVAAPGSSRGAWRPPAGTWVGGFAFSSARPEALFGPSMTAGLLNLSGGTIVDSLPDGRLVGVYESGGHVVLLAAAGSGQTAEITPLPRPGPDSTPPLLSPNGTRLALIDAAGVPYVWSVDGGADPDSDPALGLQSTRDSSATAVEAIASLTWSPDSTLLALNAFQGGYYLWDLETNEVSRDSMPGRAVAVSNTQVAAWGNNGLELRDPTGRVLRRWPDLIPGEVGLLTAEGAFDPLNRYLAVRGLVGLEDDGREGLTVLSTIGTTRRVLTTDPAQGFAWSGDGSGLYWLDSDGLQVWSADPERAAASILGGRGELFARLRVYDPAITPIAHPALVASSLMELRDGAVTRRTMNGHEAFFTGNEQATIAPADMNGRFLTVASGGPGRAVVLADPLNPTSSQVLGNLTVLQLGDEGRLVQAVALTPDDGGEITSPQLDATRWYLETDEGSILFGPDAGSFTSVTEGSALSFVGGIAFSVTPDGSAVQTMPTATGADTLLTAADLDADNILAVGVMRRALFVLVVDEAGDVHIWQVPADSELLATPLFPPAPSMTSWAWIVYEAPGPVAAGTILVEPNAAGGEVFAARIDRPDGPVTVIMAAPLALESACGASAGGACVLSEIPGSPLGFSPDGNWLLVEDGDRYRAVSTVGRGSALLPDAPPDAVAWVEAGE